MARPNNSTLKMRPVTDSAVLDQWAFMRVGSVLVLCSHGDDEPSETDLDSWLMRAAKRDYNCLLVDSQGGSPDAKQRARVAAFWKTIEGGQPPTALLTDSLVARSVLTAIGWITNAKQQAFASADLEGALRWLGSPASIGEVRETIVDLHRALGTKTRAP